MADIELKEMNDLYQIVDDFVKIKNIIIEHDNNPTIYEYYSYNKIKEIMQKYEV